MTSPRLLTTAVLLATLALAGCGGRTGDADDASAASPTTSPTTTPTTAPTGTASSTPTPTDPPTELAADFPLAAGMAAEEDQAGLVSEDGRGLRDLELCGERPVSGLDVRDRLVADNSGGESLDTRELVLLASAEEATAAAEDLAARAADCPTQEADGTVTTTAVHPSPFDDGPSAALVRTYDIDGARSPGAIVHHVVARGNALLVTATYGEWREPAWGVSETAQPLRDTVAALSALADPEAVSSAPPSTEAGPEPSAPPAPTLPHVDLTAGLPEDGGDYEVTEQNPDGVGIAPVEMCGRTVWPVEGAAGGTRRLTASASGPEHFEGRDLVVYADTEVAGNAMAPFRHAAERCRRSGNQVWTPLQQDTGHDTVTVGLTYTDGLGSSVLQVTRVGAMLLLVTTYGEGSLDALPDQAVDVTRTTTGITRQLCAADPAAC